MTLLDPESRSLYVDALRPPPQRVFDRAVATTFSLDLDTLLALPLHLVLYASESPRDELLQQGVALYHALGRTTRRLAVYCNRGCIGVPRSNRVLFSLLEPVIQEVDLRALHGRPGAFHPKVWLLRFIDSEGDAPPIYRLVVLTRNITGDASWDLGLVMEGTPGAGTTETNEPLTGFLRSLPTLAANRDRDPHAEPLLDDDILTEIGRVAWDVPDGFDTLRFHHLHPRGQKWRPPASERLAVISPFCGIDALGTLAATSEEPVALVSRAETIARLPEPTRAHFERVYTLHDAAETEDGEDPDASRGMNGLHAKLYLLESGSRTTLVTGSANATDAVFEHQLNVEFLVELTGRRTDTMSIDAFLGPDGFGDLLMEAEDLEPDPDEEEKQATERLLESGRDALRAARLGLRFAEADGLWEMTLVIDEPLALAEDLTLHVWPVTLPSDRVKDASALTVGEPLPLGALAPQSITTLIAFELRTRTKGDQERLRFVLNLPAEGLPEETRESALTRQIVANEESFLRYLLLLLGDLDVETGSSDLLGSFDFGSGTGAGFDFDDLPIVEEMARTYARVPERLHDVDELILRLTRHRAGGTDGAEDDVIPEEFRKLWSTFQTALEEGP